uniref:Pleckstrin homology domain containing, family A member 7a n=1 Tax=Oncorhynchus kisutch TaxID=8019 RepID=A0A8C7FNN3_ONCKI
IMAAPFGRDTLPEQWSFGVCGDGRVFFVHDETSTTTWLHPRTGEPVNSGHMIRSDLPRGWEEGFTNEGAGYFINHNQRTTSFRHPVTGQVSRENVDFILQEQPGGRMSNPQQADLRLSSTISEASTVDTASGSKGSRSSGRVLHFGKREQSIKRNPNVPVVVRGWLYKQDSSGMRLWKRKWFVLADYCLFYYKDSREESVLGSIPLPSYVISAVEPEDHIIRKYAFKASHTGMRSYIYNRSSVIGSQAEHSGMRTYFFSADTQEDMNGWVKAMNQALSLKCTLPRHTPPTQPTFIGLEAYQTLPKTPRHSPPTAARHGEYKYAQDRLSHFRLGPPNSQGTVARDGGGIGGPGTVWQLYEWQQRHQFRHGSPTAPLYTPSPDYPFGHRPPSTVPPPAPRPSSEVPRCVSVPPDPSDIPPLGPPRGSRALSPPRRPHMPADRVVVMPLGERPALDVPVAGSPRRAATIDRRSIPPSCYITHTVSAPSLHGKTVDDTYMQLKKDLEYLDLKDKLESVLDLSRQQMEQYRDRPAHLEKIAYQQRLLQEDVVHIRAQISRVSTEMSRAWEEYSRLESSVEQLRTALQTTMNYTTTSQREKSEIKRELWRMEDVMAGLSASKANYKITINSVQNPERKLVPSVLDPAVPSQCPTPPLGEVRPPPLSSYILPHNPVPKWVSGSSVCKSGFTGGLEPAEDEAPPRPPLPRLYDYEDPPPTIPPLPKEAAAVVRHTSVRGLKRQSDERKRDREVGGCVNGDCKVRTSLHSTPCHFVYFQGSGAVSGWVSSQAYCDSVSCFLSVPGLSGSSSQLNQSSNISSYVTLRRGVAGSERPKSALEQLYSSDQQPQSLAQAPRSRMSAEEQLERMKRHQRALVRERKRNLSQGERHSTTHRSSSTTRPLSSTDLGSWRREQQDFDLQQEQKAQVVERLGAEGQSDEGRRELKERERIQSDEWLTVMATPMRGTDMEPLDYNLNLSRELSKPQKVPISERYVESDPGEPLSQEQMEERQRRAERIINILAKSNVQNTHPSSGVAVPLDFTDLDLAMQQQKRIMNVSHALASEASIKSKQGKGLSDPVLDGCTVGQKSI